MGYRIKQANEFLKKKFQVRVTLTFKGRERFFEPIGIRTMERFIEQCEGKPTLLKFIPGRKKIITCIINPK